MTHSKMRGEGGFELVDIVIAPGASAIARGIFGIGHLAICDRRAGIGDAGVQSSLISGTAAKNRVPLSLSQASWTAISSAMFQGKITR